jgi:SprT protein
MINQRIAQVVTLAETLFSVDLSNMETRINMRGTSMGQASLADDGIPVMRLSIEGCNKNLEDILSDTIPHEVAHLVCFIKNIDNGHGANWKAVARALGSLGETTHKHTLKSATKMFHYANASGGTVDFTIIRHNKLQKGKVESYSGEAGVFTKHDFKEAL